MKTRNLTRLGALALTMTMVTTSLIGGTLAKYTTTISGTDTVTVARFGYEANDGTDDVEYTTDTAAKIDLFDDLTTDATGTVATDGDDLSYLAPGTYGSFDIELNGINSDVDIEMTGSTAEIVIAQTNTTGTPITSQFADTDEFLSYQITYTVEDADHFTTSETWTYATNSIGGTESTSADPYEQNRTTLASLEEDLTAILEDIILEKNTVGIIHVDYAWVTYDDNAASLDDEDTEIGQKIVAYDNTDPNGEEQVGGAYPAPTITLTITNTASQIVATEGNTATVDYSDTLSYNNGYTIDGSVDSVANGE